MDSIHKINFIYLIIQKKTYIQGLITTTHITHASPAGIFANTANRNWEYDEILQDHGGNPELCHDIAKQLINGKTGKQLKVLLGGGRSFFLPKNFIDIDGNSGKRADGINLIDQWKEYHRSNNHSNEYIETRDELFKVKKKYLFYL